MSQIRPKTEVWNLKRLLEWTADYLRQGGIDQSRLTAELLLAHVLQRQRIELYTHFDDQPDPDQLARFRELVRRCAKHEPVQYLTGTAHFFSLEFDITPDALIPRPETETLVSEAIGYLTQRSDRPILNMLDLCTGSGCVAIAIASTLVETAIVAADVSPTALEIARSNVEKHDLAGRVHLLPSDLFENLNQSPIQLFDLITANPPYIAEAEFDKLPENVRLYEPAAALKAGPDGLDFHRRILSAAGPYLADRAAIMLEIAFNQADAVLALFRDAGYLTNIVAVHDALGQPRVIIGHKK
jgi:release factor glutamine methyltransferase